MCAIKFVVNYHIHACQAVWRPANHTGHSFFNKTPVCASFAVRYSLKKPLGIRLCLNVGTLILSIIPITTSARASPKSVPEVIVNLLTYIKGLLQKYSIHYVCLYHFAIQRHLFGTSQSKGVSKTSEVILSATPSGFGSFPTYQLCLGLWHLFGSILSGSVLSDHLVITCYLVISCLLAKCMEIFVRSLSLAWPNNNRFQWKWCKHINIWLNPKKSLQSIKHSSALLPLTCFSVKINWCQCQSQSPLTSVPVCFCLCR